MAALEAWARRSPSLTALAGLLPPQVPKQRARSNLFGTSFHCQEWKLRELPPLWPPQLGRGMKRVSELWGSQA